MTKPKIILIAAIDRNGAIGYQGGIPWSCPRDMRHFATLTAGKILVMGRRTAESLTKPLAGRVNLVLSSKPYVRPGFVWVRNKWDINHQVRIHGQSEIWVIGGGVLYGKYINTADMVHLTVLDIAVPNADVYFPMRGLGGYKGMMINTCPDPGVQFWTFTRAPIRSSRAVRALGK